MPEYDEYDSLSSAAVPGIDETEAGGQRTDGQASVDSGAALQQQLEAAKAETEQQRQLYLRALADFENYKRRTDRFMRERSDEGRRELLKRLLPVLDNLERAEHFRDLGTSPEQISEGFLATIKQFRSLLESEGVRPIETVGKTFDPSLGEAIATRPAPDVAPNTVLDEARKGYVVGNDVLRPAQVIVSKPSE